MSLIDPAVLQAARELCPGLPLDSASPSSAPGNVAAATHVEGRFLTTRQVAEELATTENDVVELITCGQLVAIRLSDHGQWRVERAQLEAFIQHAYERTAPQTR